MNPRLVLGAYQALSVAARVLPPPVTDLLASAGGALAARTMAERRFLVARNLSRIAGRTLEPAEERKAVSAVFGSYGRYWLESFRLPTLDDARIDEGHDVTGYEHIAEGLARGNGVILVLPHLGGWEWSAFWLARLCGVKVTAVVEPLQPPELFEWFVSFRESLGMNIVPLGPHAAQELLRALGRNEIVCLLADRDLTGHGAEVSFFGERTTLPTGPAMLALRTPAPVCPTAVYFSAHRGHRGVVRGPLDATRTGRLRDDVNRLTQVVADELELLIRDAPTQWHLMQPNWPSDHEALAAFRAEHGHDDRILPTTGVPDAPPDAPADGFSAPDPTSRHDVDSRGEPTTSLTPTGDAAR